MRDASKASAGPRSDQARSGRVGRPSGTSLQHKLHHPQKNAGGCIGSHSVTLRPRVSGTHRFFCSHFAHDVCCLSRAYFFSLSSREGVWISINSNRCDREGWLAWDSPRQHQLRTGEKMRTRKASKKAETLAWAKERVARQKPLPLRLWEELGKASVGCGFLVALC